MKFSLYQPLAIHEIGKRDNQEDCIYPPQGKAFASDRLFMVCDGMGGHEHGEVASQTFSKGMADFFTDNVSADDVLDDDTLKAAIEHAYQDLDKKDDGAFRKMGTTLTLLYMHRGGATCAHIGDSRIYHIRPSKGLLYVSRDHSLVFDLYQSGEITYEEMKTSPQKNIITRAIQPGEENRVRADIIHITDIRPGDYFYLCSDGMLEQMEDHELAALFSSKDSDEKKRQKLIAETLDNKDNHSAYIIHVESVTQEADDESLVNEEPTARCNALNIKPLVSSNANQNFTARTKDASEDVVVVQQPTGRRLPYRAKKKRSLWPILFLIAILAIGGFVAYSLMGNDAQKEKMEPRKLVSEDTIDRKPSDRARQHPITHNTEKLANTPQPSVQSEKVKHDSQPTRIIHSPFPQREAVAPAKPESTKNDESAAQPGPNADKGSSIEHLKDKEVFKKPQKPEAPARTEEKTE